MNDDPVISVRGATAALGARPVLRGVGPARGR
ncbi:ABC transporter, partial [Streptomyces roseolus]